MQDISTLIMMTKTALEMSVLYGYLTELIAQEDFTKFSHHENYK
jgi:hypothetical protein